MKNKIKKILFFNLVTIIFFSCSRTFSENESKNSTVEKILQDSVNFIEMFEKQETLTSCTLYEITDTAPAYLKRIDEGNIAYYGLIALADSNKKLAEKITAVSTSDKEWEYNYGYGGTSADTALVLEALVEMKTEKKTVDAAFSTIIKKYYDEQQGCFSTLESDSGRASYWNGCSSETTAWIAYLMHRHNNPKYIDYIIKAAKYISKTASEKGCWNSRWFPSLMVPSYYSLRLLNIFQIQYKKEIRRCVDYILNSQSEDGGWDNSIIETSAAVLSLKSISNKSENLKKAILWLNSDKMIVSPEPLLYYWFEDENRKTFFSCYDKGFVADAWKKLALK